MNICRIVNFVANDVNMNMSQMSEYARVIIHKEVN